MPLDDRWQLWLYDMFDEVEAIETDIVGAVLLLPPINPGMGNCTGDIPYFIMLSNIKAEHMAVVFCSARR